MSSHLPKRLFDWYGSLFPEQRDAADFILRQKCVALFAQQRTGKTFISMAVLQKLKWPLALVVSPLTPLETAWVPAVKKSEYTICRSIEEVKAAEGPAALLVHWQLFVKLSKKLAKIAWEIVIIDESQGLKARNSGQSKAARRFRHHPRRLALSGTPMDEGEIDIWAQMRFVNHRVLGETFTPFAEKYCYRGGFMGHEWIFDSKKKAKFLRVLKPHVYRLTTGFLDLKPVHLHSVEFDLLGDQARLYRQMEATGVIRVGKTRIIAELEVTNKLKREQITGGYVLDEEDIPRFVGRAKERKLRWLLGRLKSPVVVFCQFRHELSLVKRVLKEFMPRVKLLHGGVKDDKTGRHRSDMLEAFQRGELDAIVCQTRTGGVGIDLTHASNLIFYSINHSFIDFEQTLFRLQGLNQKNTVNAYFLCAVSTVDEEKLEIVKGKESAAYNVVSHFERETDMEVKKEAAAKKAAKKPAKADAKKAKSETLKFGVAALAKEMGVKPATVRLKLRASKVKKAGKGYGWNSQADMKKVAKQLAA